MNNRYNIPYDKETNDHTYIDTRYVHFQEIE